MGKDIKITEGIYIPTIEACWIYKEMIEEGNYKVQEKYLDNLLRGKIDFSLELVENKILIDNIGIEKINGKYYTLDIVNVKFNKKYKSKKDNKNTEELRKWTYQKRFKFNNKDMVNWKRASGKAREGENLFIIKNIKDKCLDWARMGLTFQDDVDIASIRAYESLPLSSVIGSIEINPKNILVIDDFESIFPWEMSKTYLENKELKTKTEIVEECNSIWDGQGLMDSSVFNENELIKGKGMALLRNRLTKSCVFNTNIQQFLRDNCPEDVKFEKWELKDIFNNPILAKDIKLITTPNSLKIKKLYNMSEQAKTEKYKNWLDYYMKHCNKIWGVCKSEKPSHLCLKNEEGEVIKHRNKLTYQFINTIPFAKDEIKELVEENITYIEKLKTDLDFFLQEIKIEKLDIEENINDEDAEIKVGKNLDVIGAFLQLLQKNKEFANTQVFKDYRRNFINAKIKELRQGKIVIDNTDYCTICSNPIEMLMATVGEFNGEPIALKNNEVYSTMFDTEPVVGLRNPHICSGNIANLINKKHNMLSKYMNCTDNIVIINSIKYPILTILQGCDMDSDTMLLTNNKIVVNACTRLDWDNTPIPTNCVENTGKNNCEMTGENMAEIDKIISQNFIGIDINISQELNSSYNHKKYNNNLYGEEAKKIYKEISKCSSISCVEIDKAKKQFEDLNVYSELEKIKSAVDFEYTEDGRRIKPYFFKYIGDTKTLKKRKKVNKQHKEKIDNLLLEQYAEKKGIDVKDINKKDKKIKELLKQNDEIQQEWEEEIYKKLDTPMNWLQEEIDKIKNNKKVGTVQIMQLVKEGNKKGNTEVQNKIIKIIKELDDKIKSYRLDTELSYVDKLRNIKFVKKQSINKIGNTKVTQADLYHVLKETTNKIRLTKNKKTCKKYYKVVKKNDLESITLEILFMSYGEGLLNMFL
ncbi:hypothetical protein ACWO4B_002681 [Clostridium sporogenes]